MNNYSKYKKVTIALVFTLLITVLVESSAIKETIFLNTATEPTSRYEKISNKNSGNSVKDYKITAPTEKSTQTPTQNSTEKTTKINSNKKTEIATVPTEKSTEKTTKKSIEKSTEKPTEKLIQKSTEKPTEKSTQVPTEKSTVSTTKDNKKVSSLPASIVSTQVTEESTYTIPTEPATEWSQELQNFYNEQYEKGYLIAIDNPDYIYATGQVILSEEDKILACQIVFGEAGGEGFEGCCLVAQCLKDSMVFLGYNSIADVQKYCKYDGWNETYSQTALDAVEYIFDQNRSAVAHRLLYFYASNLCHSEWHETQNYILTKGYTRFFDIW